MANSKSLRLAVGSIFPKGPGKVYFYRYQVDGRRKTVSLQTANRAEALKKAQALVPIVKASTPEIVAAHVEYAMRRLPELGDLTCDLESLLTKEEPEKLKQERVEKVCAEVLKKLRSEELTTGTDPYLEPHAFEIMKRIRSRELRELHVMEG